MSYSPKHSSTSFSVHSLLSPLNECFYSSSTAVSSTNTHSRDSETSRDSDNKKSLFLDHYERRSPIAFYPQTPPTGYRYPGGGQLGACAEMMMNPGANPYHNYAPHHAAAAAAAFATQYCGAGAGAGGPMGGPGGAAGAPGELSHYGADPMLQGVRNSTASPWYAASADPRLASKSFYFHTLLSCFSFYFVQDLNFLVYYFVIDLNSYKVIFY